MTLLCICGKPAESGICPECLEDMDKVADILDAALLPRKYVYTEKQLKDAGLVYNLHMPLGNGWLWCPTCKTYHIHIAMSHQHTSDCYEVCQICKTYTGINSVKEIENGNSSKA